MHKIGKHIQWTDKEKSRTWIITGKINNVVNNIYSVDVTKFIYRHITLEGDMIPPDCKHVTISHSDLQEQQI